MIDANELVYLRARYYASALGVFASLDPVEGVNRYQYVGANPINTVDPSGMVGETPDLWDSCAQQESNCVYQCLLANPEWLQIAGEAEISKSQPEDIRPETIAAFYLSHSRFQECIRQHCNVTYIGGTPYLVTPITPPLFASSEYPSRCEGMFPTAESCMSAHLQFLRNTETMAYLLNLRPELSRLDMDAATEKLLLFASFVAPDRLWRKYHSEGTPADVKEYYQVYVPSEPSDEGGCISLYGKKYGRDVPGNIIFGFLAQQAGFTALTSQASAGIAQFLDDITSGSQMSSVNFLRDFGDLPEDQTAIRMGIALYEICGNSQCSDEAFMEVLELYRAEYVQAASISLRAECRPAF